jgi:hypothetical protein
MANNGENTWRVPGPVASSVLAAENWDYVFEDTSNAEAYSVCV